MVIRWVILKGMKMNGFLSDVALRMVESPAKIFLTDVIDVRIDA